MIFDSWCRSSELKKPTAAAGVAAAVAAFLREHVQMRSNKLPAG